MKQAWWSTRKTQMEGGNAGGRASTGGVVKRESVWAVASSPRLAIVGLPAKHSAPGEFDADAGDQDGRESEAERDLGQLPSNAVDFWRGSVGLVGVERRGVRVVVRAHRGGHERADDGQPARDRLAEGKALLYAPARPRLRLGAGDAGRELVGVVYAALLVLDRCGLVLVLDDAAAALVVVVVAVLARVRVWPSDRFDLCRLALGVVWLDKDVRTRAWAALLELLGNFLGRSGFGCDSGAVCLVRLEAVAEEREGRGGAALCGRGAGRGRDRRSRRR